jgi:uncharacterized protein YndB with AHSA1/START domain
VPTLDAIERTVTLPASPEAVWAALTDGSQLSEWFGAAATVDPRPGGHAIFVWASGEERRAVVETAEPHRELVLRWAPLLWVHGTPAVDRRSERVAFSLRPVPEGTRLTVVESGIDRRANLEASA